MWKYSLLAYGAPAFAVAIAVGLKPESVRVCVCPSSIPGLGLWSCLAVLACALLVCPLASVAISFSSSHPFIFFPPSNSGFGSRDVCWLSTDGDQLIWAFVGPVSAIIAVNIVLFVRIMNVVMRVATRRESSLEARTQAARAKLDKALRALKVCLESAA